MLLKCDKATLGYENKPVISDISFQVDASDYLCIVGENGAGKSTLVKGILGLLKPMSGNIVFGEEVRNASIGYLPQQTDAQKDFPATVMEVVLSGCLKQKGFLSFYNTKDKEAALVNMHKLGVGHLRKQSFRKLSGGQQQRVLIARALCATDKLLVLDEPVTGLDPTGTADLYAVLRDLNEQYGTAIIMVSHDVRGALPEVRHVLHISFDTVFYGTAREYRDSAFGKQFLGGVHK